MKAGALVLLFVFCTAECRKIVQVNKNANLDFITMERGGMGQPAAQPQPKAPVAPTPVPAAPKPAPAAPATTKPTPPPVAKPAAATPTTVKPHQPNQIKPVPVNPKPVTNTVTTPGPGSVKALVNFYDSQGKASPIRPYSYSQAVKQG